MLIRPLGASEGIVDYLVNGQKRGRFFSRDDLDERVVLAGDLELTEQLIESIDPSTARGDAREKYLHVTLAFREDYIPPDTLQAITDDFRAWLFSAYDEDEYHCYAEAHLPRIKSYHDARSGELVERKPHIHVVIPRINLVTGENLNPLGLLKFTERYLDAFQESINLKYGLESPKVFRRESAEVEGRTGAIGRYTGIEFEGQGAETKRKIAAALDGLPKRPNTIEEIAQVASNFGQVKIRNKGRADAYVNVQPEGYKKGINLKEPEFRPTRGDQDHVPNNKPNVARVGTQPPPQGRHNLRTLSELGVVEFAGRTAVLLPSDVPRDVEHEEAERDHSLRRSNARAGHVGVGGGAGDSSRSDARRTDPRDPVKIAALLEEWRALAALETRYLMRAGAWYRDKYKPADRARRIELLNEKEVARRERQHRLVKDAGIAGELGAIDENLRAAADHLLAAGDNLGRLNEAGRTRLVRDIAAALARGAVADGKERHGHLDSRTADPELANVIDQALRELSQQKERSRTEASPSFAEIKQKIDGRELLDYLSQSHGLDASQYAVTRGKDGAPRIRTRDGKRNLNVSDFMTREMHLPFPRAVELLQQVYALQQQQQRSTRRGPPDPALLEDFRNQRTAVEKLAQTERATLRTQRRAALEASYRTFQSERGKLLGDKSLRGVPRRAALSALRMERASRDMAARAQFDENYGKTWPARKSFFEGYLEYLQARGDAGDMPAIAELRRFRNPKPRERLDTDLRGVAASGQPATSSATLIARHRCDRDGNVTWRVGERDLLVDRIDRITVLRADEVAAIELSLRMAQQRFVGPLVVGGTTDFKRAVVETAARANLQLDFADAEMKAYQNELKQKYRGRGR